MFDPDLLRAFSQRPYPGFVNPSQAQAPLFPADIRKPGKKVPLPHRGPIGLNNQTARRVASSTYYALARQLGLGPGATGGGND